MSTYLYPSILEAETGGFSTSLRPVKTIYQVTDQSFITMTQTKFACMGAFEMNLTLWKALKKEKEKGKPRAGDVTHLILFIQHTRGPEFDPWCHINQIQ